MKVAILGSGPAGASLYRLLRDKANIKVDIFGKEEGTTCGIRPCAWGVDKFGFAKVCNRLGLTPERYYTNHCKSFYLWKFRLPCDIVVIDKALLLSDLTERGVLYKQPKLSDYDRIIDATGPNGRRTHPTYQALIGASLPLSISIGLRPALHCFWSFPVSSHTTHVGVLSFTNTLKGLDKKLGKYKPICQCYSSIHSQGLVTPLVEDGTWKVGERAGVVDPITGSGILSSMLSAFLLYENWENPEGYRRAMVKTFGYTTSKLRALFHNEFRGLPIGVKVRR